MGTAPARLARFQKDAEGGSLPASARHSHCSRRRAAQGDGRTALAVVGDGLHREPPTDSAPCTQRVDSVGGF
jgi:hypothetical protein